MTQHLPTKRLEMTLKDRLHQQEGWVYMTGMQALVRLPIQQRKRDMAAGLNTGGYISGYRGSPLGAVVPALIVVAGVWYHYGSAIGVRDRYAFVEKAATETLVRNLTWCPTYWANWYWLGRGAFRVGTPESSRFAVECIARAAALAPYDTDMQKTLEQVQATYGEMPELPLK